ncbi:MAG: ArsR/SmtB family transcription factor [Actinomycetaceae bacterium]
MTAAPGTQLDMALRALADANRRAILAVVRDGPRPVGVIAEASGLSQQTASHHLAVLRDAGLATRQREGTRHLYAVRTDGVEAVRDYLDGFWPSRLAALKAAVEGGSADGENRTEAPGVADPRGSDGSDG